MIDSIQNIISKMQNLENLATVARVTITFTTSHNGFIRVLDPEYNDYDGEFNSLHDASKVLDSLMDYYGSGVVE